MMRDPYSNEQRQFLRRMPNSGFCLEGPYRRWDMQRTIALSLFAAVMLAFAVVLLMAMQ